MAIGWFLLWVTTFLRGEKSEVKSNNVLLCIIIIMKILANCRKGSYGSLEGLCYSLLFPVTTHLRKLLVTDTLGKTDPQLKTSLPEICLRHVCLWGTCGGHRTTQWNWVSSSTLRGAGLMIKPSSPGLFARRDPLHAESFCQPQGSLGIT